MTDPKNLDDMIPLRVNKLPEASPDHTPVEANLLKVHMYIGFYWKRWAQRKLLWDHTRTLLAGMEKKPTHEDLFAYGERLVEFGRRWDYDTSEEFLFGRVISTGGYTGRRNLIHFALLHIANFTPSELLEDIDLQNEYDRDFAFAREHADNITRSVNHSSDRIQTTYPHAYALNKVASIRNMARMHVAGGHKPTQLLRFAVPNDGNATGLIPPPADLEENIQPSVFQTLDYWTLYGIDGPHDLYTAEPLSESGNNFPLLYSYSLQIGQNRRKYHQ